MKDYKGKINNSGTQAVQAPYPQQGTKLPVQKGTDLRKKDEKKGGSK